MEMPQAAMTLAAAGYPRGTDQIPGLMPGFALGIVSGSPADGEEVRKNLDDVEPRP
jgi:hypothetical protein